MAKVRKVAVLYDNIIGEGLFHHLSEDNKDNIIQRDVVFNTLKELGYKAYKYPFNSNSLKKLSQKKDWIVFNIVESINGEGKEIYKAPEKLEELGIHFTGANSDVMKTTTDKVTTKKILRESGLSTPNWVTSSDYTNFEPGKTYIVKPENEDASIGISQENIFTIEKLEDIKSIILAKNPLENKSYFAEEYIDGREFNISIFNNNGEPTVLPPAELLFTNYSQNQYKVASYNAKWDEESFEYKNTNRTFAFPPEDEDLIIELRDIAYKCWKIFNLKGYARVDFRVDSNNKPWILEINANPCISPDSGFVAAANYVGLSYKDIIESILIDLN